MSWLGYIGCGMFGLMALGIVFMLAIVLYDTITEAIAERRKQHGNREADRGVRGGRI